jgi:hypothetical protein
MFGFGSKKKSNDKFAAVTKNCSVCRESFTLTPIEVRFYSSISVSHQKCRACRSTSPFDQFEESRPLIVNSGK